MMLPSLQSLKAEYADFIKREEISLRLIFQPKRLFHILNKYRFLHFLLTGGAGVAVTLLITWSLTRFVFGTEHYLYGYIAGIVFNLLYNFILYTRVVFQTKSRHASRLAVFSVYNLAMTYLQTRIITAITSFIGAQYYLIVITAVIGVFCVGSFLLFKLSIFKEHE